MLLLLLFLLLLYSRSVLSVLGVESRKRKKTDLGSKYLQFKGQETDTDRQANTKRQWDDIGLAENEIVSAPSSPTTLIVMLFCRDHDKGEC